MSAEDPYARGYREGSLDMAEVISGDMLIGDADWVKPIADALAARDRRTRAEVINYFKEILPEEAPNIHWTYQAREHFGLSNDRLPN